MRLLINAFFVVFVSTAIPAFAYDPEIGELAKTLDNIEFVDGKKIDLNDFKGKPLVIYVGADWCPPCVSHGRPEALRVAKKYGDSGLQTIFVSLDDNKIRSLKVEESKQIGLPIAMPLLAEYPPYKGADRVRLLGKFGRAFLIPAAYVIDSNGIVRAKMDSGRGIVGALEPAVTKVIQ
jgi:thiol-disulfide isomerase/thioredoxin